MTAFNTPEKNVTTYFIILIKSSVVTDSLEESREIISGIKLYRTFP